MKYVFIALTLLLAGFFVLGPQTADEAMNRIAPSGGHAPSAHAQALHATLWIADLHADSLLWNRDLLQRGRRGHVDIPRLIEGNVALQAFTLVSSVPWGVNFERNDATPDMIGLLAFAQRRPVRTWCSPRERALHQAARLHDIAAHSGGRFRVIRSKTDLRTYIYGREGDPRLAAGFLGIEGAQALEGDLANLQVLFDAGVRMMSPSHFFDTAVGGSAHGMTRGGLTPFGKDVIREMERLGMIVDLAHASPKTFDDVLAVATKPLLVSHAGVRGTCDNGRNLDDVQLEGVAAKGGVVGIAYFEQATCGRDVASIVRAIAHAVRRVGARHVALGSDFDGAVETPFDTTGLVRLTEALIDAGLSGHEIAAIMGGNVRRLLLELLPD